MKIVLFIFFLFYHETLTWNIFQNQFDKVRKERTNTITHPVFKNSKLLPFLTNKEYEIQIRYTEIIRDSLKNPTFKTYSWNENSDYFYPASCVKMPVAFAALQKFNEIKLKNPCLSIKDPFIVGVDQKPQTMDTVHRYLKAKPTLEEHLRLIFSISDNNSYNRLFEFTGQEYINKIHRDKGIFTNSHIIHRVGVGGYSYMDNQYSNPLKIGSDQCIYQQKAFRSIAPFRIPSGSFKGKGYANASDSIIMRPFDFTQRNYVSLRDLEASLMRIIFPEYFKENQRYNLTNEDYKLLYKILDELPRDIPYLKDNKEYYDTYVKFFYGNGSKEIKIPDNIHIFNKVGFAYGTLSDCSYIFDTQSGAEFFLTATILVNKNQIFNDGKYEYDEIGLPFLGNLGMTILEYEQKKDRKYKADFKRYIDH